MGARHSPPKFKQNRDFVTQPPCFVFNNILLCYTKSQGSPLLPLMDLFKRLFQNLIPFLAIRFVLLE
jgi:hypothetical protein